MITITLKKIKAQNPCKSGWKKIVKARGGKLADYEAEFPLSAAFDSNTLDDVLWALRCFPEHNNLWRKYTVWCARQVHDLMTDLRSDAAPAAEWDAARDAARDAQKTKLIQILDAGKWVK